MMLYRFVDQQKADGFPVERICDVAGVSRSAYYDWKRHRDGICTIAELAERRLVKEITDIHDESDGTYGSPRVTIELRNWGFLVKPQGEPGHRAQDRVGQHRGEGGPGVPSVEAGEQDADERIDEEVSEEGDRQRECGGGTPPHRTIAAHSEIHRSRFSSI